MHAFVVFVALCFVVCRSALASNQGETSNRINALIGDLEHDVKSLKSFSAQQLEMPHSLGYFDDSVFTGFSLLGQGADKIVIKATVRVTLDLSGAVRETKFGLADALLKRLDGKTVVLGCEKSAGVINLEYASYRLLSRNDLGDSPYFASAYGTFKAACLTLADGNLGTSASQCDWIMMPLLPGTNLDEAIASGADYIGLIRGSADKFRRFVKEGLTAISLLHASKIVHGDVKTANMRIVSTDEGVATVVLFDYAALKTVTTQNLRDDSYGSLNYDTFAFAKDVLAPLVGKAIMMGRLDRLNEQLAGTQLGQDAADKCAFSFFQACMKRGVVAGTLLAHKYFNGADHSVACV